MIDVSIVVPAYNSARTLRLLLDVLTWESSVRWSHEVLVIDDASTDDTRTLVQEYPIVRYLRQAENGGPARARNRGVREAKGEYVIFIDSDLVPESGFLDRLMQNITQGAGVAGVVGVYAEEPLFKDGYVSDFRNLQTHFWKVSSPGIAQGNFPVSLSVLRRADLIAVGGLTETFSGADVEDFELGQRMSKRGYTFLINPRVQGHHHPEETLSRLLRVLFRRTRQYAAIAPLSGRTPSHYATPSRSLTLAGTVLTVMGLIVGLWHWVGWLVVAAVAYVSLVVFPEADYYRFLYRKRKGVIFAYYCLLQFVCNVTMTAGLLVGALGGLLPRFRALVLRTPRSG